MPKTLSRLLRSGQQIQTQHTRGKKKETPNSSDSVREDGAVSLRRKRQHGPKDCDDGGKSDREPLLKRQKGESLKAYLERIDVESNARVMEAYRKTRVQSERRKRYVQLVIRIFSVHLSLSLSLSFPLFCQVKCQVVTLYNITIEDI